MTEVLSDQAMLQVKKMLLHDSFLVLGAISDAIEAMAQRGEQIPLELCEALQESAQIVDGANVNILAEAREKQEPPSDSSL